MMLNLISNLVMTFGIGIALCALFFMPPIGEYAIDCGVLVFQWGIGIFIVGLVLKMI